MRNTNALDSMHVIRITAMRSVVYPDKLAVQFTRIDGHGIEIRNVYYTGDWSHTMRMIANLTYAGTLRAFPAWHNNTVDYEVIR